MNGSNCMKNESMRTPAGGLPCELVALLVAPSQAKVTEAGSELDHWTLLLVAGLKEASVERGDALGALR